MKKMAALAGLIVCMHSHAQTFSEWFFQNKTQIKYLHKQIAALAVFIHDLDKGYTILHAGTGLISWLQQEDQEQHKDYFASLLVAKPAVANDPRISSIREWAVMIGEADKASLASANGQWLRKDEVDFIQRMVKSVQAELYDHLSLLDKLIGGGYWEMSDAERMARIEDLYQAMRGLLRFSLRLRDTIEKMIIFRQWDWQDGEDLMNFFGIKS